VKTKGKRKAFHVGGNSSCRAHIRQHYDIYKEKCEKANIAVNHWAIPRHIYKEMQKEKEEKRMSKKTEQQELTFQAIKAPCSEFTRAGTLHMVTKLIAVNNQVSCYVVKLKYLLNLPSPWRLRTILPFAMFSSP
jgi:DNA-binding LacI/PurR family transcriptional regulator